MINHVIWQKGEALPEHHSDSNVYLMMIRGTLSARFNEQESHRYTHQIINVPVRTSVNISNGGEEVLEFFIVKAPHPRMYGIPDTEHETREPVKAPPFP